MSRSTQWKKAEESSLSRVLTPCFHVIFHESCFFNTNRDITKNNWLQKFRYFSGKSYKPTVFFQLVSFSKGTSQQCSSCNLTIKRTHHRFVLEYVPKTSCIKKYILRKKSAVDQRRNKVSALLCTGFSFIEKQSSCKAYLQTVKSPILFTGKPTCQRLFWLKLPI